MRDGGEPAAEAAREGRSLRHVRAAQLRARALRWAIGKSALGSVFLLGALSYGLGPEPGASGSRVWMALLVVLSTFNVGLGLRTFGRIWRWTGRYWLPLTLAWGILATVLLRILIGGVSR